MKDYKIHLGKLKTERPLRYYLVLAASPLLVLLQYLLDITARDGRKYHAECLWTLAALQNKPYLPPPPPGMTLCPHKYIKGYSPYIKKGTCTQCEKEGLTEEEKALWIEVYYIDKNKKVERWEK